MGYRFESLTSLLVDDVSVRWLITLMHFLWQGGVVAGAVVIIGRFMHGSSGRIRYTLYSAALLSLPICVAVTFCVVAIPASPRSSAVLESPAGAFANGGDHMAPVEATEASVLTDRVVINEATRHSAGDGNSGSTQDTSLVVLSRFAPWIAATYVIGVVCFLMRLLVALWGGHRLRAPTTRVTDARLLKLIVDQANRVKLKCVPVVAYCERVAVPTVVGVVRPMVLLPVPLMTGMSSDDFSAIIRHEFAHVRRYDLWMNLLQRIIESILFFHPVVWFISRRLNAEREICCDDLVVSSGYEPLNYAGALLRMAELCTIQQRSGALSLAASGDRTPLLEKRIERLLNWSAAPRLQLTPAGMASFLIAFVALIALPGLAHTWVRAQTPGQDSRSPARPQPVVPDAVRTEAILENHNMDGTCTLVVRYEIEGGEEVAKVAVRRVATDDYIGTERLRPNGVKINSIKNGGLLVLSDLVPGDYDISRESSSVYRGLVLDHQRVRLRAGEKTLVEISRPNGKSISGHVAIPEGIEIERVFVWVCPVSVKAVPRPSFMIEHGLDVTRCNDNREFATGPIAPGRYAIFVECYEPPSALLGIQRPRLIGRAEVVVPAQGKPAVVEVNVRDLMDDIDYANYVRGASATSYVEQLKPTWSETKLGVQFGISHRTDKRSFSIGDRIPLTMFIRNVSDKAVKVGWATDVFATIPNVADRRGKAISLESVDVKGGVSRYNDVLKPGDAFCFSNRGVGLGGNAHPGNYSWYPYWEKAEVGTYELRHTQSIAVGSMDDSLPTQSESFTAGTIYFDVVEKK